jgi:hypothetical protein
MYAMSRFDPTLFPPEEADVFVSWLFSLRQKAGQSSAGLRSIPPDDGALVRDHIITLYRRFMEEGGALEDGVFWAAPLLRFLRSLPQKAPADRRPGVYPSLDRKKEKCNA